MGTYVPKLIIKYSVMFSSACKVKDTNHIRGMRKQRKSEFQMYWVET